MNETRVIQVVSDVVCPWCYIGKRRLEKAFALLGREDVEVRWTAFELNPDVPGEGWNRREYRQAKFGSLETAQRLEGRVIEAGAQEGIHFRFDLIEKTPNTFDAHRLIWLAEETGVQDTVVENLFRAYFLLGRNVGDRSVLREVGLKSGLEGSRIDAMFESELGVAEVAKEEREARTQGVSGVPTFFVNGQALTSGAHPSQLLAGMLQTALSAALEKGACQAGGGNCA